MRRFIASIVLGGVACFGLVASAQEPRVGISVFLPNGQRILATVVMPEPYKAGMRGNVYTGIDRSRTVRTTAGLVISGFSFYAWPQGDQVRVVVLAGVPREGTEARVFPPSGDPMAVLRFEEFASYTMSVGESRTIDEMKAVGLEPMSIRVEPDFDRTLRPTD